MTLSRLLFKASFQLDAHVIFCECWVANLQAVDNVGPRYLRTPRWSGPQGDSSRRILWNLWTKCLYIIYICMKLLEHLQYIELFLSNPANKAKKMEKTQLVKPLLEPQATKPPRTAKKDNTVLFKTSKEKKRIVSIIRTPRQTEE